MMDAKQQAYHSLLLANSRLNDAQDNLTRVSVDYCNAEQNLEILCGGLDPMIKWIEANRLIEQGKL
jgi:hypothetical protein